ncbi:histone H1.1-like [Folsomia candida]|uniref:histone H1.1-like n=1 Tax=Folsomia candida TaxID=158441 RepID=UPI000B909340|nr:histone H1.1-like [Folsomia candida]
MAQSGGRLDLVHFPGISLPFKKRFNKAKGQVGRGKIRSQLEEPEQEGSGRKKTPRRSTRIKDKISTVLTKIIKPKLTRVKKPVQKKKIKQKRKQTNPKKKTNSKIRAKSKTSKPKANKKKAPQKRKRLSPKKACPCPRVKRKTC